MSLVRVLLLSLALGLAILMGMIVHRALSSAEAERSWSDRTRADRLRTGHNADSRDWFEARGNGGDFESRLACRTHPYCPTSSVPENRSAARGSVFWLPDQPMLRAFPAQMGQWLNA